MGCRDQRLYKAKLSGKSCDIQPLTPEDSKLRFADAVIDQQRNRLIAVCEDHSKEGEAVNTISSVGEVTEVTGYRLQVTGYRLQVTGYRTLSWLWDNPCRHQAAANLRL